MNLDSPRSAIAGDKANRFPLLNLATGCVIVAWLAVASYALAYLISH